MVALIDLVMGLVESVIERIDLDRRIARRRVSLYVGDVTVTDARHRRIMRLNLSPFREEFFSFAQEDIPQR